MPDALILAVGLLAAGVLVLLPLSRDRVELRAGDDDWEAAAVRHRVALEALRDVEADHRAGLLGDAPYAAQRAQAEDRAAVTRAALEHQDVADAAPVGARGRGAAIVAAGVIGTLLLGGSVVPATGIANETVVNERLAATEAAEAARQERIRGLLDALAEDPADPDTLSDLADAHLAGSSADDLVRGAVALRLLIDREPDRADAYERIIAAYLRAGDHPNARAAHTSYVALETVDPVEATFYDGLIALRGENDAEAATEAFDRFLELAPQDPRAPMIRGLLDEASGGT